MNPIRIEKHIDSETLHLPELKPLIGHTVQIIVLDQTFPSPTALETWETFLGLPLGAPAANLEEIAALQADPRYERFQQLLTAINADAIDVDAIVTLRSASPI